MVARIALVFAGFIVAGVFLNIYYLVFTFFTVFLLGVDSKIVLNVQYWICFVAGIATSFFLMRKAWPIPSPTIDADQESEG